MSEKSKTTPKQIWEGKTSGISFQHDEIRRWREGRWSKRRIVNGPLGPDGEPPPKYLTLLQVRQWFDDNQLAPPPELEDDLAAEERKATAETTGQAAGDDMAGTTESDSLSLSTEAPKRGPIDKRMAKTPGDQKKIPPAKRTRPMSLREAARFMGYGTSRDAAEKLRAAIDAGAVLCETLTRQQHVFSLDDFPKKQWPQATA
jgi:hypothetical protein